MHRTKYGSLPGSDGVNTALGALVIGSTVPVGRHPTLAAYGCGGKTEGMAIAGQDATSFRCDCTSEGHCAPMIPILRHREFTYLDWQSTGTLEPEKRRLEPHQPQMQTHCNHQQVPDDVTIGQRYLHARPPSPIPLGLTKKDLDSGQ